METEKITSVHAIAERLVEALTSLGVFVADRRLIEVNEISRIIAVSGVDGLINKAVFGDIVVYTVKDTQAEAKCRQTECRDVPKEKYRACVTKCFYTKLSELLDTIKESIIDAVGSLEE